MLETKLEKVDISDWRTAKKIIAELDLYKISEFGWNRHQDMLVLRKNDDELLSYIIFDNVKHDSNINDRWGIKTYDLAGNKVSHANMWNFPGYDKYLRGVKLRKIDYIRTRDEYQRKGCGKKMITAVKEGADMVELISVKERERIEFYFMNGFIDTGLRSESGRPFMVWVR